MWFFSSWWASLYSIVYTDNRMLASTSTHTMLLVYPPKTQLTGIKEKNDDLIWKTAQLVDKAKVTLNLGFISTLRDIKDLSWVNCWDKILLNRSWKMLLSEPLEILIMFFWMSLTHYQTTNFRLFQTERVCRRQFQIWWKWQKIIQMGRKHCGKRRNCSLWAISPFPTVFSKGLFPRGIKRRHCVGMGK